MHEGKNRQESNGSATETTSSLLIDSEALGKPNFLRILHVDNDASFLLYSKLNLEKVNKFEIDTVTSVDEAFNKLRTQHYDAVLSDYAMPFKTGLDFLKEVREQKNEVPFILFASRCEEVAFKALNLGADRYINKSDPPELVYNELKDSINELVERKKTQKLLVESDSKYRILVEKSLQGIMIALGNPLHLVFANESMGKMLGYSPEELISLSSSEIAELIYFEDRPAFFNRFKSRLEGKQADTSYEFRGVKKDDSIIWLESFANLIEYNGQQALQAMFLVLTNAKKLKILLEKARRGIVSLPIFYLRLFLSVIYLEKSVSSINGPLK
jgi:PAS domain S-box-containing protein